MQNAKSSLPILIMLSAVSCLAAGADIHIPASAINLWAGAEFSSNFDSLGKGLRGDVDHMIYDVQEHRFIEQSLYHEYGVGFGQDLGVVTEDVPAWWMAQWSKPVEANLMIFSGVYPNQPQPDTVWKIELRKDGKWTTHARGVGGWYNSGRYVWGGPDTKPITFDAIRISLFSKDDTTHIKSIHLRGEEPFSWILARCSPLDAQLSSPVMPIRAGLPAKFHAAALSAGIKSWNWDFGDGAKATGPDTAHVYDEPGTYDVILTFSDDKDTAKLHGRVTITPPVKAVITPLEGPVMVGKPVSLQANGSEGLVKEFNWDIGDGSTADGPSITHTFDKPGIYKVTLIVSDGRYDDRSLAIIRAHTPQTLHVPQVYLDTDQKNEQDDQHYLSYGLFSQLDVLGVDSIHHGGGQEPMNYEEILHILDLANQSGLSEDRIPFVFRGADRRLDVPESGKWYDTVPVVTHASDGILAAARGASPSNPVWVVPVGPGTNVASAILQARFEGLELKDRIRVMWLGGSNNEITNEFNGNNDPWSIYVISQSGIETWVMPAPVGGRVIIDKTADPNCYPDNPLGKYLYSIMPARRKSLYDPSCLAAITSLRLGLGWIKQTEFVTVASRKDGYRWIHSDSPTSVRLIRQIDEQAIRDDIFKTINGKCLKLLGAPTR